MVGTTKTASIDKPQKLLPNGLHISLAYESKDEEVRRWDKLIAARSGGSINMRALKRLDKV